MHFSYVIVTAITRPYTGIFRAVPGVSLYMTSLTHMRAFMTRSPVFVEHVPGSISSVQGSVLPKLSNHGNLLAGAVTRVGVGFMLNPFSVLKARFEVSTRSAINSHLV